MKNSKVGVVILTYNSEKFICQCLASVKKNIYSPLDIVIVDNNSTDKTIETVRKQFPKQIILQTGNNIGFAAGNNVGIRYLLNKKCEYILLLNPDTKVSRYLIRKLLHGFFHNKHIGIVGPIISYLKDQDAIWFAGGYFNETFCFTKHPFMNQSLRKSKIASRTVDFITGACMMIRSDMIKSVGLLPEKYFLYFEDAFYCKKIRGSGFECYLIAQPLVCHIVSASTGDAGSNSMSPLRAYFYARNPLYYLRTEAKGIHQITGFIGQFCIRLPYYLLQMLMNRSFSSIVSYFKGLSDGITNRL